MYKLMKNKYFGFAALLIFLGWAAWIHISSNEERRQFSKFLLDNDCSRYYTVDGDDPLYRCDKGVWTRSDIENMI
jgi:hypothetical protein